MIKPSALVLLLLSLLGRSATLPAETLGVDILRPDSVRDDDAEPRSETTLNEPAEPPPPSNSNLLALSLEELLNVEVRVAGRVPDTLRTSPGTVYTITKEDIELHGWRNLGEALNAMVPNMYLAYEGHKYSPGARGFDFDGLRMSVMMDGRQLRNLGVSPRPLLTDAISMLQVERIEILMGPNSTLYGSAALEAVVNIITKTAAPLQAETTEAQVMVGDGDLQQFSFVVRQARENADLGIHYTQYTSDQDWSEWARYYSSNEFNPTQAPTMTPSTWQMHKEDRALNLYGRYKNFYAGLNYQRMDATPDSFEAPWFFTTSAHGRRDIWEFTTPYAGWQQVLGDGLSFNLEYQHTLFDRDKLRGIDNTGLPEGRVDHDEMSVPFVKGTVEYEPREPWLGHRHRLTFGFEHTRNTINTADRVPGVDGGEFGTNPGLTIEEDLSMIFLSDTIALKPEEWLLTVGASHNRADSVQKDAWTPRASLVWMPDHLSSLKFTYGEGFRQDIRAKPLNEAEILRMSEISYHRQVHYGRSWHGVASVSLFHMEYDNMIRRAFVPLANPTVVGNAWKTETIASLAVRGVEGMVRMSRGDLNGYLSANWNDREEEMTRVGKMEGYVPKYMLKAGVGWNFHEGWSTAVSLLHLGKTQSYVEDQPYDGSAYRKNTLPSWTSVDLNLTYQTKVFGKKSQCGVRVGNIFNEDGKLHYAPEKLTGLQVAPRNIRLSLSTRF